MMPLINSITDPRATGATDEQSEMIFLHQDFLFVMRDYHVDLQFSLNLPELVKIIGPATAYVASTDSVSYNMRELCLFANAEMRRLVAGIKNQFGV